MAKQSGLHQIRGKVGEHSYYRQTGVTNGLIRSINQGLSSRVKTSDEYANTRLNNAEFGQAGSIARVLGAMITPKYRPMILPFSQAKMARSLLSAIKSNSAPWGQRNLSSVATDRVQSLVDALNIVSKGDFDNFGIKLTVGQPNEITISGAEPVFPSKLAAIGADGCTINLAAASPAIGLWTSLLVGSRTGYAPSFPRANYYTDDITVDTPQMVLSPSFPPAVPEGSAWMSANFFIVILMPYRTINGKDYILQEHCTYKAMSIPA